LRIPTTRRHFKELISIPSGAIKSELEEVEEGANPEFQFLLVRLRERSYRLNMKLEEFQFLLVRLRAEAAATAEVAEKYFNSFWCD